MSLPVSALKRRRSTRRRVSKKTRESTLFCRFLLCVKHGSCCASGRCLLSNGCTMATAMLMFIAANVQYLASITFSAFVLLFVFIRKRAKQKNAPNTDEQESPIVWFGEETDSTNRAGRFKTVLASFTAKVDTCEDTVQGEKSTGQRKYRKKSYKKKKNRGTNVSVPATEQIAEKMEGQPKPEEPEKHRARRKHRKNTAETFPNQNKPVKFYEALPLYVKLQLDQRELYHHLLQYALHPKELEENGFPLECPDNPGRVVFSNCHKFASNPENSNQRLCCRCCEKFTVSDDGLYEAETVCHYHSGKRLSINGVSGAGAFSCCGSYHTTGCTTGKHHVSGNIALTNAEFVKTREKRQNNSQGDGIYALDCEMCYTIQGLEVTRISVVGTDGLTVYDSYVLPENPVVDYNTAYSGITANDLKDVKTTLADVQAFLLKLLNARTILVGHGLENDLRALHLIHTTVVDTSVVFPHAYGLPYKRSLRALASHYLKQDIQQSGCGHDSVEDARTCMELMLWKIEADSHLPPIQHNIVPPQFSIPPTQQWAVSAFSMSPNFVPCHLSYWVPPVGSSCDLY